MARYSGYIENILGAPKFIGRTYLTLEPLAEDKIAYTVWYSYWDAIGMVELEYWGA